MYEQSKKPKSISSSNEALTQKSLNETLQRSSSLNETLQKSSLLYSQISSLDEYSQSNLFNKFKDRNYGLEIFYSEDSQLNLPFFTTQEDQTLPNSLAQQQINLAYLNDYVFYELFDKLSLKDLINLKYVNRRFYLLVNNYMRFNLKVVLIFKNDDDLRYLKYNCVQHQQTEYNSIKSINNFELFLNSFLINLIKLKVISISFLKINETTFKAFTNLDCIGKTLEHLEISHSKFEKFTSNASITYNNFFKKLDTKLKHFIFFKNSGYILPFDFLFKSINKYLINLDTIVLDLKQFENLKSINGNLMNCKSIKHLDLHGYLYSDSNCDKLINKLIFNRQLEFLNLSCININHQWLNQILENCLNIRVLKFSYDNRSDNRFGRTLITSNCIFNAAHFHQTLHDLQRDGTIINQFTLASKLSQLTQLEELNLLPIESADVNIDPLILYLYHRFKKNKLKRLIISNYEYHLMNVKAFLFVSKNLSHLILNEWVDCCYSLHSFKPIKKFRTLNSSFTNAINYLPKLEKLILNQFNFENDILEMILFKCGPLVKELSFLRCLHLDLKCIELFVSYANSNFERQIKIKLDYDLVCKIEKEYGLLCKICPSNLNIIAV